MDPADVVEQLLVADVLDQVGDSVRLSDDARDEVDDRRSRLAALSDDDRRREIAARIAAPARVEALVDICRDDVAFVARLCVLADATDLDDDALLHVTTVLGQLLGSMPRADGAPEAFLPVHGDHLPRLLRLYPNSVVYVWLDDCEPCDVVRGTFDELLDGVPDEIALFAVYGPDSQRVLADEYDVAGGPATLFVLDGAVDTRIYGASHTETFEHELNFLRERT